MRELELDPPKGRLSVAGRMIRLQGRVIQREPIVWAEGTNTQVPVWAVHHQQWIRGKVRADQLRFVLKKGTRLYTGPKGPLVGVLVDDLKAVPKDCELDRVSFEYRTPGRSSKVVELHLWAAKAAFRHDAKARRVPPLRERTGDIPALVHHFLERKTRQLKLDHSPVLADGAIDRLMRYDWPGNVRELENIVERALIICRDSSIRFDLGRTPNAGLERGATPPASPEERLPSLDEMTSHHIRRALELAKGKIHGPGGAGELLGINPNTLRSRMRKLGIPFSGGR